MTTPAPYIDALERALGRVIGETRAEAKRQIELLAAQIAAALAAFEAKGLVLEARSADIDRAVREQVAEGIAAGIAAIEKRWAAREADDAAPLAAVTERLDAVEARDFGSLEARLVELENRPDVEAVVRGFVDASFAALPEPVSLEPLRLEIAATRAAIPEVQAAPDLSGFATRDELASAMASFPELPQQRDWSGDMDELRGDVSSALTQASATSKRIEENVAERLARHTGVLPEIKGWTDGVHYAGDLRVYGGATWQARHDTGKAPPHEDWSCIAMAGRDGRSPANRGLYDGTEQYRETDIVVLDGGAFWALRDDPGPCPGDGWQMLVARGRAGKPGDKGERGEVGKPGPAGPPGEPLIAAEVSDDGLLTLTNADGTTLDADFYPVLAKVAKG